MYQFIILGFLLSLSEYSIAYAGEIVNTFFEKFLKKILSGSEDPLSQ